MLVAESMVRTKAVRNTFVETIFSAQGKVSFARNVTMKYKTKPYEHQLECLKLHGEKEAFALLAEMGTGKTKIIIDNVADLHLRGLCDALIVFAPNGVHSNWTRLELPTHMPDEINYKSANWTANGNKAENAAIEEISKPFDGLRIFTMNWEALQNKRGFEAAGKFVLSSEMLMIVCDESDSVKNPKATRTKNLMRFKEHAKWRRIMTGTVINNSPFDLFSQFGFLDEWILQTPSFYAFKNQFAEMLQPGNALVEAIKAKSRMRGTPQIVAKGTGGAPKYRNLDKLSKLIAPYSFRILKKDCLDLPDKIYKTLFFEMTTQQKAVYKKMKKECRVLFEEEETPFTQLVAMGKLAQITSGYVLHPSLDTPLRIEGKTPKLDMTIDRIKQVVEKGNKVIVWARYRVEIEDIVARLKESKIPCVEYHGGVKKKDRIEAIDSFENGNAQVFVGNQQAGGTGITLVAASYVIYFSNSFSLRDRLQSEDRAHRIGQKKNVTYINIVAKGTIDETVIHALMNKKNVAEVIIDKGLELLE